jgi:hypothetical protein
MIVDVLDALNAALKGVTGVRVYEGDAAVIDPPGAILSPPALAWDSYRPDPTSATVTLSLAAPANDRALRTLLGLLPLVVAAVDEVPDAAVMSAAPGTLTTGGGTELPAYLIEIEVSI